MDEKITYEEMLEQLDQKGFRVTDGARRLHVALNNGVKADVLFNWGPAFKNQKTFTCEVLQEVFLLFTVS